MTLKLGVVTCHLSKSYKNAGPTMKNCSYSLASNVVVCLY